MNNYTIIKKLDEGGFSQVFKVQHRRTGKVYAMKKLKLDEDDDSVVEDELTAFKTMLYHDNVVQCCEVFDSCDGLTFIMEFCTLGSLNEYFVQHTPAKKRRYAFIREIAAGVAHLHRNDLIHRDLKPDNIFITGTPSAPTAKIGDFGLAKFASDAYQGTMYEFYMTTLAGTIFFLGPEVYDGHYTAKADVFSMGLIFAAIICFDKHNHDGLYVAIIENGHLIPPGDALRQNYDIDPLLKPTIPLPVDVRSIIMRMLRKKPGMRPTAEEVETEMWNATHEDEAPSSCVLN